MPAVHDELTKTWQALYSERVNPSTAAGLSTIDSTEEKGYSKLPPLEEAVAAYLCPTSTRGLKTAAHPSKPCRMTSALANRAYAVAVQAGSALHMMSVQQVFHAKLLCDMDECGRDLSAFRGLCNVDRSGPVHYESNDAGSCLSQSLGFNSTPGQPGSTPSRSVKVPALTQCWTQSPRSRPDLCPERKRRGQVLAKTRTPSKKAHNLSPPL